MSEFDGKVAIVLGASTTGGMGQAVVRRLHHLGAKVVIAARNYAALEALATETNGLACAADITDAGQIQRLIADTLKRYGRIDFAVNAVGQASRVPMPEIDETHLMEMARLHFIGPALFIRDAAEAMSEGGAIVNISSLTAYDALPGLAGYAASKYAGDRIVQAAALEYRHKRLRINTLVPSLVLTELSRRGMRAYGVDPDAFERSYADLTPLGRIATPEDIAAFACLMLSDAFFETGQVLHCSGGQSLLGQPRFSLQDAATP